MAINLISLGSTPSWSCHCHRESHAGKWPRTEDLRKIVARRERTTPEAIEEAIHLILRLPKDCRPWQLEAELAGVSAEVGRLVMRSLSMYRR